jgi:two-component system, NtrC family, sensor histidine kinase KinB
MKVKNKLRLGFGFLFVVVIAFGVAALYSINRISNSAEAILKDNYKSLDYVRGMRAIIDDNAFPLRKQQAAAFNNLLTQEEQNITEPTELEAVQQLRKAFDDLQATPPLSGLNEPAKLQLRKHLRLIETVNMNAIMRKNNVAQQTEKQALLFLGLVAGFTFLVLVSFFVNFPGYIADPLNVLLKGIREVSRKNYKQRIEFKTNDEFAEVAKAFNEMSARLNEWETNNLSRIQSQNLRIETIVEQMRDAIIGISDSGELLFINTAAKKLFNVDTKNITGKPAAEIAAKNELLALVFSSDEANRLIKITRNAKELHFQIETREIFVPVNHDDHTQVINKTQMPAGKVYILRNITEFKEQDTAKTNFIATLSHELKTPISSIKMSLKLLADQRVGQLNTEQQQLAKNMTDDAERLLKITFELLDMAQVETGNLRLNFVQADAHTIVNYAINAVRQDAERKQVIIDQIIEEELPAVYADVEKTAWVLINFLLNAVRYAPSGSAVTVQAFVKNGELEFSVTDKGKGIEEQYQERLFDRYFQIPADGQNKTGSGLGLAISKEFIIAQGGNIGVKSKPGEGAKFYFLLPVSKE